MIIKRKSEEKLQKKLEEEKDRLTEMMGFRLLPYASKTTVMNVLNSSEYKEPNGDSCIGYWEKVTGFKIDDSATYHCPACGKAMSKKEDNLVGAHVYKPSNPDEWFFTPLCSSCNTPNNTNVMEVTTPLVPVPAECYEKKDA